MYGTGTMHRILAPWMLLLCVVVPAIRAFGPGAFFAKDLALKRQAQAQHQVLQDMQGSIFWGHMPVDKLTCPRGNA